MKLNSSREYIIQINNSGIIKKNYFEFDNKIYQKIYHKEILAMGIALCSVLIEVFHQEIFNTITSLK